MSKPKESKTAPEAVIAYSVSRFESGYYVVKHIIESDKVISTVKMSEPDVLTITMSTLEKFVRKDKGL